MPVLKAVFLAFALVIGYFVGVIVADAFFPAEQTSQSFFHLPRDAK